MIADVREVFDLLEFENILQAFPIPTWRCRPSGRSFPRTRPPMRRRRAAAVARSLRGHGSEAVLTDEDMVREIARSHPDYGLMRMQKELRRAEYGWRDLNPVQLYVLLRKLGLDTREGRQSFAKTGQATPAAGADRGAGPGARNPNSA